MSSGATTLSQINAGRVQQGIVLRLLRHWCARNIRRGGQVTGMDLLFVDGQSTIAHATLNLSTMSAFQPLLREGAVYLLSNFDVDRVIPQYRLSDFNLTMRLNASTSLVEIAEPVPEIPTQVFRFRTHPELASIALSNTDLPDIMGQVSSTNDFHDGVTNNLKTIVLPLTLQSGHQVLLKAFGDKASELDNLLQNKKSDFCVLLATNVNPTMVEGKLYVNATTGTRFFFNDELQATRNCMESFKNSSSLALYQNVHTVEHVSIAEMYSFILTSDPQDIEYLCTGKIIDIQRKHGWSFLACSLCGKRLHKKGSSLTCNTCKDQPTVEDVKYRVEFVVADNSSTAVFVVFDDEMEKLTRIDASSLITQMDNDGQHGNAAEIVPQIISNLIGSTFTFHLRLTVFNFGPYHSAFTVSRIITDRTDMPKPTFLTNEPDVTSGCKENDIASTETHEVPETLVPSINKKKQKLD